MGERYLIPTLYTRVSVRLTTPTQKSVSIDTSGDGVNLPDCTDLCNRLKIECISITPLCPVCLIALSEFCDQPGGFLAASIRFWMHPPVKVSPLLGIRPQRYRQMWRHCMGFASGCVGTLCRCVGNRFLGSGNESILPNIKRAQNPLFSGSALVLYAV